MLVEIFYFQILFYAVILLLAIKYRSPSFFLLIGVLSIATAVQISGEGLEYYEGWSGSLTGNSEDLNFNVSKTYGFNNIENSNSLNMWYYILLLLGFVWIIASLALYNEAGTFDMIKGRKR